MVSRLGLEKFDKEETFAEKFGYPSSIFIKNRNEGTNRVSIRIRDNEFDLQSEKFLGFLKDSYKAFPK